MPCTIRPATEADFDAMWNIFHAVVSTGRTYVYAPDTTKAQCHTILMTNTHPFVAEKNGQIVGLFVIRSNHQGLGSHVCNAGFMVCPEHRRKGIGRAMGEHALVQAKELGYRAMQFNVVVSTNKASIALWKSLGFTIIGTVPDAFDHADEGLVAIHIMHRFL